MFLVLQEDALLHNVYHELNYYFVVKYQGFEVLQCYIL